MNEPRFIPELALLNEWVLANKGVSKCVELLTDEIEK
jgi:hypothetical protein